MGLYVRANDFYYNGQIGLRFNAGEEKLVTSDQFRWLMFDRADNFELVEYIHNTVLMAADAAIGATQIVVDNAIPLIEANEFWVVIDPYTVECEVRKVTNIAADNVTLTVAALDYAHVKTNAVFWTDNPDVNVKWFNAKGDGTTNDTTAVQRAVNQCAAGARVYFPIGTYLAANILLPENVNLYGDGWRWSEIKQPNSTNGTAVLVSKIWNDNGETIGNPIRITDLLIDGNSANNTSGHGILLANHSCFIERVQVRNTAEDGIRFSQATQDTTNLNPANGTGVWTKLRDSVIHDCTGHGFRVVSTNTFYSDGWMTNNHFYNCTEDVIRIDHAAGWSIEGNHLWGTIGAYGIHLRVCLSTRVYNNEVERYGATDAANTVAGIYCHTWQDAEIFGNKVRNNNTQPLPTYYGIRVQAQQDRNAYFNITGNHVTGNGTEAGIRLEATAGTATLTGVITGNTVENVAQPVSSSSTNSVRCNYAGNYLEDGILTITANDATPKVSSGTMYRTANTNPTTITDFDWGAPEQEITVFIGDALTTVDFTGTNLKGNAGADWSPANGDFMVCRFDSTTGFWFCQVHDATA